MESVYMCQRRFNELRRKGNNASWLANRIFKQLNKKGRPLPEEVLNIMTFKEVERRAPMRFKGRVNDYFKTMEVYDADTRILLGGAIIYTTKYKFAWHEYYFERDLNQKGRFIIRNCKKKNK